MSESSSNREAQPSPGCIHDDVLETIQWNPIHETALHVLRTKYSLNDTDKARIFSSLHKHLNNRNNEIGGAPDCVAPICPSYVSALQQVARDVARDDGSLDATRLRVEKEAGIRTKVKGDFSVKKGQADVEAFWNSAHNKIVREAELLGIRLLPEQANLTRLQIAINHDKAKKTVDKNSNWLSKNPFQSTTGEDERHAAMVTEINNLGEDELLDIRIPSTMPYAMLRPEFNWGLTEDEILYPDWTAMATDNNDLTTRQAPDIEGNHIIPGSDDNTAPAPRGGPKVVVNKRGHPPQRKLTVQQVGDDGRERSTGGRILTRSRNTATEENEDDVSAQINHPGRKTPERRSKRKIQVSESDEENDAPRRIAGFAGKAPSRTVIQSGAKPASTSIRTPKEMELAEKRRRQLAFLQRGPQSPEGSFDPNLYGLAPVWRNGVLSMPTVEKPDPFLNVFSLQTRSRETNMPPSTQLRLFDRPASANLDERSYGTSSSRFQAPVTHVLPIDSNPGLPNIRNHGTEILPPAALTTDRPVPRSQLQRLSALHSYQDGMPAHIVPSVVEKQLSQPPVSQQGRQQDQRSMPANAKNIPRLVRAITPIRALAEKKRKQLRKQGLLQPIGDLVDKQYCKKHPETAFVYRGNKLWQAIDVPSSGLAMQTSTTKSPASILSPSQQAFGPDPNASISQAESISAASGSDRPTRVMRADSDEDEGEARAVQKQIADAKSQCVSQ